MSNQKRLEEYLIGNEEKKVVGYLKDTLSNGKVIMLSGKWGSGKTHFWKNIIATEIFEKELKEKRKSYAYISLYGKNTIESIQNDLLYNSYEFIANPNEKVSKFFSVFTYYSQYSPEKISSGIIKGITDLKNKFEFKKAESYLSDGGIICFDDFERKSKNIDLNDLFGFITNLTIEFDCKVVIILNDDVFEGEEKKIFSNVKEKSVSKFLKYEPSIKELFETIFENDEEYRKLDDYKEIILSTIEETEELNARIYIQVFDNLVEWIGNKQEMKDDILRYLIFININFILYHCHFIEKKTNNGKVFFIKELDYISDKNFEILSNAFFNILNKKEINVNLIIDEITTSSFMSQKNKLIDFINDNKIYIKIWYLFYKYKINHINVNNIFFQKINNFIETGILINE